MLSLTRNLFVAATAGILFVSAASAAPADVKAGVDAWQSGDFKSAVTIWRALAEKGDPDAQFNMGQAYKLGRGVPGDMHIAQSWYQKAAQQGHPQAQANLGLILFQSGQREAAMPWLGKAADNGDPRAQYVMGTALFNGDMVAKDWPRAYAMMTRAAAQGLPQAASNLQQMDKYTPLEQPQRGIALARQMKKASPTPTAAAGRPAASASASSAVAAAPAKPAK